MPTVLVDDVPFKHKMSAEAAQHALAYVEASRKLGAQDYEDYVTALKRGDKAEQVQRLKQFFKRPEVKLNTAIRVAKQMKPRERPTLDRCLEIAGTLDLYGPINEASRIRARGKSSGGVRVTHAFGIQHKTAQHMVKRVLSAHVAPRPFQYTHKGTHAAIIAVREALASGYRYVAHLDICEFYPSFELEMLAPELPLPPEVVQRVVVGRHMATVLDKVKGNGQQVHLPYPHTLHSLTHEARRGLPQGSISSSSVGTFSVSQLDWPPIKTARLVNYADNFLIVATNMARLEKRIEKLVGSVGKMPGGCFKLKLLSKGLASGGVNFLGHTLHTVSGRVHVRLSEKAINDLFKTLLKWEQVLSCKGYLIGHYDKLKCAEMVARMLSYVAGWREAFKLCEDVDRWASFAMVEIEQHRSKLCLTHDDVLRAMGTVPKSRPSPYSF